MKFSLPVAFLLSYRHGQPVRGYTLKDDDQRGRHGKQPRGSRHGAWNPGLILSSEGYIKLRVGFQHPLADPNGYAYAHLVVWCAAGNLRPTKDHVLKFKNDDKTDYRLRNFELLPRRLLLAKNNVYIGQDAAGRFVADRREEEDPSVDF